MQIFENTPPFKKNKKPSFKVRMRDHVTYFFYKALTKKVFIILLLKEISRIIGELYIFPKPSVKVFKKNKKNSNARWMTN